MIIEKRDNWILLKRDFANNKWLKWDFNHIETDNVILTKKLFKSCPFLEYIFQGQDILFVLVAGSIAAKTDDSWSDYDLIVFTKDNFISSDKFKIIYKNKHIHWYYRNINTLVEEAFNFPIFYDKWGLFAYYFITDPDCLLYVNSEYINIWKKFQKTSLLLAKLGVLAMKEPIINFINSFLDTNSLKAIPLKYYYHIVDVLYFLQGSPRDIDYLKKIKRIEYNSLSEEDFIRLKQNLIECKDLLNKLNWDQKILIKEWNTIWGIEDRQ